MSSIDDRVVNMQFNNQQFQKGTQETISSLDNLKKSLALDGATSGIDNVQAAANRFSLQGISDSLANISSKFSVFGAIGLTVIQDLTNAAINQGKKMAGALIDPLVQGGEKRALALQQAKFQFQGLGLDIQSTMDAALNAVKGTAFGLDDAATAAAQFGASGITAANGLEKDLRAIAGVAAQTGSSYESVAQIFESVAGNGRLMGQDLLQLSSRGVNAAAILAKSMGTTEAAVRQMVTDGKISFQQFSDAMNQAFGANAANANQLYTGALSNMHAALARIGADIAAPRFLALRDIFNAMTPAIDNIHTALGPVLQDWSDFQASSSKAIVGAISNMMGSGLLGAIENIVVLVRQLGLIFHNAFARIFPDNTTSTLSAIARFLDNITAALIPTTTTFMQLQRTLQGVFAIFDIIGRVVGGVIGMLWNLLGFATQGSGSFLSFTASVGDWLVKIDDALKKGNLLNVFFQTLGNILKVPMAILGAFFGLLGDVAGLLGNLNTQGLDNFVTDVQKRFTGLITLGNILDGFFKGVAIVATAAWVVIKTIFQFIAAAIKGAVGIIQGMLSGLNFDQALQVVNTGLFASFILVIRGFFGNLGGVLKGNGVAVVSQFKAIFNQLKTNLKALEMNTNAKTLTQIAIAVALLAASAVALSLINTAKLAQAMAAITGLLGSLIGTFAALEHISGVTGVVKLTAIGFTLDLVAGAILVLAGAVAILAALPFARLSAAVGAVIILLASLVGTLALLSKMGPQVLIGAAAIAVLAPAMIALASAVAILSLIPMDKMAIALGGLAVGIGILIGALWSITKIGPGVLLGVAAIAILAPAMVVLASAVAILSGISLDKMAIGMGAMVVTLAALSGALLLLSKTGPGVLLAAASVGAVAVSMSILAGVVAIFAAMSLGSLIQGMVALAAGLAILVGGMLLLSLAGPQVALGAAAMVVASVALTILTGALKVAATMSWDDIGRSLVVLAGSLLILAGAMALMGIPLVLLGAVGITAAAVAMMILAPALKIMGSMSWDDIGRGMALLGASIAILAVGGVLLIPASVGFLLLGAAILLLGQGVFLAATGVALFAGALGLLVVAGTAGLALFSSAIDVFIQKLPALGIGMAGAIVNMIVSISEQAPALITAFVNLILLMLAAIDQTVPALVNTATLLIITFVNALVVLVPFLANAGLTIINGVLQAIADHISDTVALAMLIITNFIDGISRGLPGLIQSGINLIITFINSLADGIRNNTDKMNRAGANLLSAIVDGMTSGIRGAINAVVTAAKRIANAIPNAIKSVLHINSPSKVTTELGGWAGEGVAVGLDNKSDRVESAAGDLGDVAISSIKNSIAGISSFVSDNLDVSPTIRPVIDLDGVKSGVQDITKLMPKPSLSVDTSSDVATSVSLQEQAKNAQLVIDMNKQDQQPSKVINFTQNNNSPKALTTTEIYRNTKNQLSTLKGDLGVVDQGGSPQ